MFMLFSFILLPLSGIPLHFSRTAIEPSMLEHYLMSVHNVSALIFLIAAGVHLSLNWSALTRYVAAKTEEYFHFKKEMVIALLAVLVIVALFSSHALHAPPPGR